MKTTTLLSIAVLAVSAAGLGHAADDLTVVSNVTTNGKSGGTETNYISSDHIKNAHSAGTTMIIDLKSGVMTNIDEKKKTYYVVTKQDMDDMQAKMAERMNDPRIKQAMEAMKGLTSSMASSTEVKRTGVKRKVAGFACEEWVITMSPMTMTECVTSDLKYPVASWAAMAQFSESMRKTMSGFGGVAKAGADYAEKLQAIKGFPVATSTVVDVGVIKSTTTSEVTEVSRTPIPASTWDVPAGFTKVENPMMKGLQKRGR